MPAPRQWARAPCFGLQRCPAPPAPARALPRLARHRPRAWRRPAAELRGGARTGCRRRGGPARAAMRPGHAAPASGRPRCDALPRPYHAMCRGGRASAAKLGPLRKARRLCSAGGRTRVRIWLTVSSVSFRMPLVHDTRICARAAPRSRLLAGLPRAGARAAASARATQHSRHLCVVQFRTIKTLNTGQPAGSQRPAAT